MNSRVVCSLAMRQFGSGLAPAFSRLFQAKPAFVDGVALAAIRCTVEMVEGQDKRTNDGGCGPFNISCHSLAKHV